MPIPPFGSPPGLTATGAQTATNKILSDVFMGNTFQSLSATKRSITLLASTNFLVDDHLEIGASFSLTIPATSNLEIRVYAPILTQQNLISLGQDFLYPFIESGCVWTDDYLLSLKASMSGGYVWINGKRLLVKPVVSHSFNSSQDTYVDFQDNGDGTASITYTQVANNSASAALANSGTISNTLRNAIVVTSNSNGISGINQGSLNISNGTGGSGGGTPFPTGTTPLYVSDSIGNLIGNNQPRPVLIGQAIFTSNFTSTSASDTQITQMIMSVLPGTTNRKIKVTFQCDSWSAGATSQQATIKVWQGSIGGTQIAITTTTAAATNQLVPCITTAYVQPTVSTVQTYFASVNVTGSSTVTLNGGTLSPIFLSAEWV